MHWPQIRDNRSCLVPDVVHSRLESRASLAERGIFGGMEREGLGCTDVGYPRCEGHADQARTQA